MALPPIHSFDFPPAPRFLPSRLQQAPPGQPAPQPHRIPPPRRLTIEDLLLPVPPLSPRSRDRQLMPPPPLPQSCKHGRDEDDIDITTNEMDRTHNARATNLASVSPSPTSPSCAGQSVVQPSRQGELEQALQTRLQPPGSPADPVPSLNHKRKKRAISTPDNDSTRPRNDPDKSPRKKVSPQASQNSQAPTSSNELAILWNRIFRARPTLFQGAPSFHIRNAPLRESRLPDLIPLPPALRAKRILDKAVEFGDVRVDLGAIQLTELTDDAISPLRHLKPTRPPTFPWTRRTSGDGTPARPPAAPCLALFLANNLLTQLPTSLYQLQTLTVLSLQNNLLEELPSAIIHMINLVELHIGGNKLSWLPLALLHLIRAGKLQMIRASPNPFLSISPRPTALESTTAYIDVNRVQFEPWRGVIYSTPVTFFGTDGSPLPQPKSLALHPVPSSFKGCSLKEDVSLPMAPPGYDVSENIPATNEPLTRVPSLLELAVLQISQLDHFSKAEDYIGRIYGSYNDADDDANDDDLILPVTRLLRQAEQVKREGGNRCSVCQRSYIVTRCEWVEWREMKQTVTWEGMLDRDVRDTGEEEIISLLPFLAKGCSWRCVPDQAYMLRQRFALGG